MVNKDVLAAVEALSTLGFESVYDFLHEFLKSEDSQVHHKAGLFTQRSGFDVITLILGHSKFAPSERVTAAKIEELGFRIGTPLMGWRMQLLKTEIMGLSKGPECILAPKNVNISPIHYSIWSKIWPRCLLDQAYRRSSILICEI